MPARTPLAACDLLIDTLRGQIAKLRRMQFGASLEKLGPEIEQLELALEELEPEGAVPAAEVTPPDAPVRPAPVRALPDHLPREDVIHEPASGACTCPDFGGTLRRPGADTHEMLDTMPVRWRSCGRSDRSTAAATARRSSRPGTVSAVARGKANFATLAHAVVAKFNHQRPLYRRAEMMAAQRLDIDRSMLPG